MATPIAASLGDLVTLGILSMVSTSILIHQTSTDASPVYQFMAPQVLLAIIYLIVAPACFILARGVDVTKEVLVHGWTPVLAAMMISSGGGKILSNVIKRFPGIAAYQPVVNGVAGNLVSVHVSAILNINHIA